MFIGKYHNYNTSKCLICKKPDRSLIILRGKGSKFWSNFESFSLVVYVWKTEIFFFAKPLSAICTQTCIAAELMGQIGNYWVFFLAPPTYCIFLIYLLKIMTARTQVKRRGISRQVINYTVEQRQSNQKWQTVFKRLSSSIKQAACLCQLWVWKKTIQLKRPRMFTHTHSYAAPTWSILYCVLRNAAHDAFFIYFFSFHICHKTTHHQLYWSTNTAAFEICRLPPVKKMVGHLGIKLIKAPQK